MTPSRNLVSQETAESNRERGGYTFNSLPPADYEGIVIVVACVRLGDHAHLDVRSGRSVPHPGSFRGPLLNVGDAGRLILRWDEWLVLRGVLDADERVRIAEVEKPTPGQARTHTGARAEKRVGTASSRLPRDSGKVAAVDGLTTPGAVEPGGEAPG